MRAGEPMTTAEQNAIAATASAAARVAAELGTRPPMDTLWSALAEVPDPEIPVVSVVELGIVRRLAWVGEVLVVAVTPTYSGCPATELIAAGIREALESRGVQSLRIETWLSPPWSTDWIAPEAKVRLREFGITPPGTVRAQMVDVRGLSVRRRPETAVPCPRCGATQTTLVAQFGSTACKALYRCEACREPFDYFKPF
jgi:ring-1,2-phenylacetyl-CoA epoxidase subunit PaaD